MPNNSQCCRCGHEVHSPVADLTCAVCDRRMCGTCDDRKGPCRIGPKAPDMVNRPPHYTAHPSGIEPIQITRHMNFNLGNALKYIMRADFKGKPIEDLKKAVWYLRDEIKLRSSQDPEVGRTDG